MHSLPLLASFGWIENWFWPFLCLAVAVPLLVIFYGARKVGDREVWLTKIVVPVLTSLVVALVGIGFALESGRRQRTETESDRQTSLMRELMISQDRRDTSYLLSLHLNLNIHLHRYIQMKEEQQPEERIRFEEVAIFFFYSKHRAALVNLRSSEGNLVFRRLWMENVFEQLAINVVESILGGVGERDPRVSAEGESATYKLFGARVHTSETNDEPRRLGGHPMVLADFDRLISDQNRSDPQDQNVSRIKEEFRGFQQRLHNGDKQPPTAPYIDKDRLINSLLAMQGLVAYSYQDLFSAWYGLADDDEEIPRDVGTLRSGRIPKRFLHSMWYDFEPSPPNGFTGNWEEQRMTKWRRKRQHAWDLILQFRPQKVP